MLRWVRISHYCELSGDTADSVAGRIQSGAWKLGQHANKPAANEDLWVNLQEVAHWRQCEREREREPNPLSGHYRRSLRNVSWADRDQIRAVYAEARRRTEETGVAHHVDHVLPLLGTAVSGLHVHNNLRVVPWRENLSKGNKVQW